MLERYYVKLQTLDRIRAHWLGETVERYVTWLNEQGYAIRNVYKRVPILLRFGDFAKAAGAECLDRLPEFIEPFAQSWQREHACRCRTERARRKVHDEASSPVRQMLALVLPDYAAGIHRRARTEVFATQAPGFIGYLREERGLRESSVGHYRHHLRDFEVYLSTHHVATLSSISVVLLSGFVTQVAQRLSASSTRGTCACLKVFLRYLHREGIAPRDLSTCVESPRRYRLSDIPRTVSWEKVGRMLEAVDQRSGAGRRDYAILLLLVTYGLRAHEVARLTLEHMDWKEERLNIPARKAGHFSAYPLSPLVGNAIIAYLRAGRARTQDRHLFLSVVAPLRPISPAAVTCVAGKYLRRADVSLPRLGAHALRHTCVQRLVQAQLPLSTIGQYIGHGSPASTMIYTKLDVEALRELSLGDGEAAL